MKVVNDTWCQRKFAGRQSGSWTVNNGDVYRTVRLRNRTLLTTFAFVALKNNFPGVNLPIYKMVGVLALFVSEFSKLRKFNVAQPRSLQKPRIAHFTLLLCWGRRRNQSDCILHVQFHCFVHWRHEFADVLYDVAVDLHLTTRFYSARKLAIIGTIETKALYKKHGK